MRDKEWAGRAAGILLAGLLAAVAVGCLIGFLEVIVFLWIPGDGPPLALLAPAIMLYSGVAVVLMLLLTPLLVVSSLRRRTSPDAGSALIFFLSVAGPFLLFLIVGGHVNFHFFPSFAAPASLVFDAAFLLLLIMFGFWFYRKGGHWLNRKLPLGLRGLLIIWVAAALAAAVTLSAMATRDSSSDQTDTAAPVSVPNVLLISVDAMRPDHMSAYGYHRATTPNLERLAREGTLFRNAYANSSWTKASVGTMFTSLYPSSHGGNSMGVGLSSDLVTLPELMKERGYATGIFTANTHITPLFGYEEGVDRFYHREPSIFGTLMLGHIMSPMRKFSPAITFLYRFLERLEFPGVQGRSRKATAAPGLNKAFLSWVDQLKGRRPFFAYFHYMEPHEPYRPPRPFNKMFDPGYKGRRMTHHPIHELMYPFSEDRPLPEAELRQLIARYDGGIAFADQELGKLFEELKKRGLYDNTLILVSADHGEVFYEHKGWGHGKSLFEELIRVPLIVRSPGGQGGQVVDEIVQHIDYLPTILSSAGVQTDQYLEGRDLGLLLKDPAARLEPKPVFSEVYHGDTFGRSIRDGNMKLIEVHHHDQEAWFLFDLEKDPKEENPLDIENHPQVPALKELLARTHAQALSRAVETEKVEIDEDTRENLRALGYVQ